MAKRKTKTKKSRKKPQPQTKPIKTAIANGRSRKRKVAVPPSITKAGNLNTSVMKDDPFGLTPKQKAFTDEYCQNGFNGYKAALVIGATPTSAVMIARSLLRTKAVVEAVNDYRRKHARRIERKYDLSRERIILELCCIAFVDHAEAARWFAEHVSLKDSGDLPSDITRAVQSISTNGKGGITVKFYDKKGALEMLERMLGYDIPPEGGPNLTVNVRTGKTAAPQVNITLPSNGREKTVDAKVVEKGDGDGDGNE